MILSSVHGEVANRLPTDGWVADGARNAQDEQALQDLARLGFVRRVSARSSGTAWRWSGHHPTADRGLLRLLARFDLHLEVGLAADETAWIAGAIQEHADGDERPTFSGTGFQPDEAIRTCLGEFAEFRSWLYRPGDDRKHCDQHALGGRVLDPWSVLGFAPAQRDGRPTLNAAWLGYDSIPAPNAFDGVIDWTTASALRDGSAYCLPAQLCYGHYGKHAKCTDGNWRSDSNGCAAGPTRQRALAHALLELVERDATGIWWYGRVARPALPRSLGDDAALGQALTGRERMGQNVRLLDLTHDLEIPVVAAILASANGNLLGLGFGCDLDPARAARSAYGEMCQMELSIAFAGRRVAQAGEAARPEDRQLLDWLSAVGRLPHLQPDGKLAARRSHDIACDDEQTIDVVRDRLHRAGLAAYVVDLERLDIGVPAVRAFAPGLCHFKPRLGFSRLVDVPRALRWRDASFGSRDLSDVPLLI